MFCPKCYASDHPDKGDKFVVFGSTDKIFHPHIVHHNVGVRNYGYTPHIISFSQPLTMEGNKVKLTISCGVCQTSYYYEKQALHLVFKEVGFMTISLRDFKALLMKWTNTGYELL